LVRAAGQQGVTESVAIEVDGARAWSTRPGELLFAGMNAQGDCFATFNAANKTAPGR
jgi:hypothetical protein